MEEDIYGRLASLLWLLSPTDVAELVRVADEAVDRRLWEIGE